MKWVLAVLVLCVGACSATGGSKPPSLAETGGVCGGADAVSCASDNDYCAMPGGVCSSGEDATGVCTFKPKICAQVYMPVCGCDGVTYGNACGAAGAGVSVAYAGRCR